jgi:pimeloyl-ACP methyl ester carboxylesterase
MDRRKSTALLAGAVFSIALRRLSWAKGERARTQRGAGTWLVRRRLVLVGSHQSPAAQSIERVTSVQNSLTTLEEAVAETQRTISLQDAPTVLVGHSFSGMLVAEAGMDQKVTALVYVAARAPDAGEHYAALAKTTPRRPQPPISCSTGTNAA